MAHQSILEFSTPGRGTIDITDAVAKAVRQSGVQCGIAHVFVQHTSCSLTITENADPDVRRDLDMLLGRLAPTATPPTATIPKARTTWPPTPAAC